MEFLCLQTYEVGNKMHMLHSIVLLASPLTRKPFLVSVWLSPSVSHLSVFLAYVVVFLLTDFFSFSCWFILYRWKSLWCVCVCVCVYVCVCVCVCVCAHSRSYGSPDSLLVRALNSWWKGHEFRSRQEQQKNFFSTVNFVCLLLFSVCSTPELTAVACKRQRSFCQSAGGRLHLNMRTPFTQQSWSGLTMLLSRHSVGTYPETAHT